MLAMREERLTHDITHACLKGYMQKREHNVRAKKSFLVITSHCCALDCREKEIMSWTMWRGFYAKEMSE